MAEEWKTVEQFPQYEVSNLGRVRSRYYGTRAKISKDGYAYFQPRNWAGRPIAVFSVKGVHTTVRLDKLVAEAFLGKQPAGTHIIRTDFNSMTCSADKLRYATKEEYSVYIRTRNERKGRTKCRDHKVKIQEKRRAWAKVLAETIWEYKTNPEVTLAKAAEKIGVDASYISFLANGKRVPLYFQEEYAKLKDSNEKQG